MTLFQGLVATADQFRSFLTPINAYVSTTGSNSLDALLKNTAIPHHFEVLSIDIDSYDSWVWESLTTYNPKIVIIEVNSSFSPGVEHRQPPDSRVRDREAG